jgi:RHS repeat-associated protein
VPIRRSTIQFFFQTTVLLLGLTAVVHSAKAQGAIGDTTTTPIAGVPHDYINGANEIVNPANGALSIRIGQPVPHERGQNWPAYAFVYDSNGFYSLQPGWTTNTNGTPTTFLTQLQFGALSATAAPNSVNYILNYLSDSVFNGQTYLLFQCTERTGYVYGDPDGGQHGLGIQYGVPTTTVTSNDCDHFSVHNYYLGGDDRFKASMDQNTHVVTVTDLHGNNPVIEDANGNYHNTTNRTASVPARSTSQTQTINQSTAGLNITSNSKSTYCDLTSISKFGGTSIVTKSVTLPNGEQYSFQYDSVFGLINKITYPTGATVTYTWSVIPDSQGAKYSTLVLNSAGGNCSLHYDWFAITKQVVSYDGTTNAQEQDFSYTTTWPSPQSYQWTAKTTTVTTKDLLRGTNFNTVYTYSPMLPPAESDYPLADLGYVPVEKTVQYYDTNGALLKTTTKVWTTMSNLAAECETLPNGQTSGKFYVYQPYTGFGGGPFNSDAFKTNLPTDVSEYDYGQVSTACVQPSAPPIRETVTAYQVFPNSPISVLNSIQDRPSSVKVYGVVAGAKTLLAETDYVYDGSTPSPVSPVPYGHDETNFGSGSAPRGNPTTVTRKCFVGGANCTNSVTTYAYDTTGQVLSATNANSNTTTYSYADSYTTDDGTPSNNTNAFVTKITRPVANGVSHITKFTYGFNDGKLRAVTDENNHQTKYCYWTNGCSGTTFDPFVRLSETDRPDGGKTTITYNDAPYNASTPSPSITTVKLGSPSPNITTLTAFDGLGHTMRSVVTSDPDCSPGDRTDTTYDGLGRVYKVSNPYCTTGDLTYGLTTYTYDALGRTTQVAHPDGSTILTTYTGSATQVQDEGNGTQRVTRVSQTDALGRLTQVVEDPVTLKFETDYTYDALNDLLTVNQKGGSTNSALWRARTFAYDSLSRLTQAVDPESGTINYVYDANGNLTSKTSPAPNQTGTSTVTTTYQYDALNRLTQKSYSDGVTLPALFGYDQTLITMGSQQFNITNSIGRMSWNCILHPGSPPSCAGSMTANSYDPMGRLAELWQENPVNSNNIWVSYGYDLIGDETNRNLNNLNYAATFSGAARLLTFSQTNYTNATNPPNLLTGPHYNAFGQLSLATFANGLSESWNYDNRGRLKGAAVGTNCGNGTGTCSGSSVYSFSLGFAPNSNIMTANDSVNGNWTYSYDQLNRLSGASSTSGQSCKGLSWTYDAWGNRTDQTVTNGICNTFHAMAGTNNRLASPYTYDAAGNATYDGVHHYTYDPENHIISVDNGATTYTYDALGRRVAKSTGGSVTDFIYDREGHVILTNPATPTMIEMYAAGLHLGTYVLNSAHTATVLYYDHGDWLGTERARADLSGNACEKISSLPFGDGQTITGTCGDISPRHFTGKERDTESGLDNLGARYFGSSTGRFQSPDPGDAGAMNDDPQSWNAYAYARNNPLLYGDPDGQKYQICDNTGHCSEISDKDFNDNFLNAKNVQLNGNQISIQDANGNFNNEGTFKRTSFDDLDAQGNAFFNEMSARREPSLNAIKVFAVRSVTDSLGGAVIGRTISAGIEAIQAERAAAAAVEASAEADAALIANGHAFAKHAGEFGNISQPEFQAMVKDTISNPSDFRYLSNGRSAFWSEENKMVVIRNPGAADGGTAFSPAAGKAFFENLH